MQTDQFDVLVVHTKGVATSASSKNPYILAPFTEKSGNASYNESYGYFLKACAAQKLKAAFTTSSDLDETGDSFKSYWSFKNGTWNKVLKNCSANLIFDKFSPINKIQEKRRKVLFSNEQIKPFNNPKVYNIFFDKFKTHQNLKDFTIPTVALTSKSSKGIKEAIVKLKRVLLKHKNKLDFETKLILKDRFGAGGRNIFIIEKKYQSRQILKIVKAHKNTSFIIQPFIKFGNSFSYKNHKGFIDIRTIYLKNKLVQVYLRIAKENDFRCNEHQGGTLDYIPTSDLPKEVRIFAQKLVKKLNEKTFLFTLDFVVSDKGNIYLMEGNCGPGLDWNLSLKKNEIYAKKLIRMITEKIARRLRKSTQKKTNISSSYRGSGFENIAIT